MIKTIRREYLHHIIPFNENHLRRILASYVRYHNKSRLHGSLNYDSPEHREKHPPSKGRIISIPEVGDLHHRYERRSIES